MSIPAETLFSKSLSGQTTVQNSVDSGYTREKPFFGGGKLSATLTPASKLPAGADLSEPSTSLLKPSSNQFSGKIMSRFGDDRPTTVGIGESCGGPGGPGGGYKRPGISSLPASFGSCKRPFIIDWKDPGGDFDLPGTFLRPVGGLSYGRPSGIERAGRPLRPAVSTPLRNWLAEQKRHGGAGMEFRTLEAGPGTPAIGVRSDGTIRDIDRAMEAFGVYGAGRSAVAAGVLDPRKKPGTGQFLWDERMMIVGYAANASERKERMDAVQHEARHAQHAEVYRRGGGRAPNVMDRRIDLKDPANLFFTEFMAYLSEGASYTYGVNQPAHERSMKFIKARDLLGYTPEQGSEAHAGAVAFHLATDPVYKAARTPEMKVAAARMLRKPVRFLSDSDFAGVMSKAALPEGAPGSTRNEFIRNYLDITGTAEPDDRFQPFWLMA